MNALTDFNKTTFAGSMARGMFGNGIAVATCEVGTTAGALFPIEEAAVLNANPSRKREFTAGRGAARRAISGLGVPPAPIGMHDNRAPIWPEGLTGSISHCDEVCIAAVGRTSKVKAIGLDVEHASPLDRDLVDIICTEAERAWLERQRPQAQMMLAKLIFSAKETAYKCQFTLSQELFDFHRFEVRIDVAARQFSARFRKGNTVFATNSRLIGKFAVEAGLIVTSAVILPEDAFLK